MKKLTVAILFGGCSSEYPVSLHSSYSVITSIDKEKYDIILIGITKDGVWYRYDGPYELIEQDKWLDEKYCTKAVISPSRDDHGIIDTASGKITKIDVAFPVFHGMNGEDGTIQGLFELAGIKYVGCGVLASAVGMDKDVAHRLCAYSGIDVPKFVSFGKETSVGDIAKAAAPLGFPVFIKPINAGSSFGITKAHNEKELKDGIKEAFKYDTKVTIEENIDGFEVGCAVMGNNESEAFAGSVDEIEIKVEFFDYKEKYTPESSEIHLPARISEEKIEEVRALAKRIYGILGCDGMARVDMFISGDRIVFNEINTIPGFTSHSRYPGMMKAAGIGFTELIDRLIGYAVKAD